MSIIVNGKELEYKNGLMAIDLVKPFSKDVVSCKINGKLRDLVYNVEDGDKVDLLGLDDEDSVRVEMKLIVNNNNPFPLRGLPLRQGENMRGNRQQTTDNRQQITDNR